MHTKMHVLNKICIIETQIFTNIVKTSKFNKAKKHKKSLN